MVNGAGLSIIRSLTMIRHTRVSCSRLECVAMRFSPLLLVALAAIGLAGCQTKPAPPPPALGFAEEPALRPALLRPDDVMHFPGPRSGLRGRTIRVGSISDLVLARNEVVLTFDDGPMPGKTPAILKILDDYGVKATFLMVGQMAQSYPKLVRDVAAHGHSIGTHTQDHKNLASLSFDSAVDQIDRGRRSVARALIPTGSKVAPFFRFPYLASTQRLRRHLAMRGIVVVSPTVDSKDYFSSTPEQVRARTMTALERQHGGIVLFHDIHARTVKMLPAFLDSLKAQGFHVVHLVPKSRDSGALVASAQ